ncbi:hypothetical protein RFI_09958 [Reticulomyxa filosa]|uniref:Actin n=1 Tax=Reticulomyxa filosa TaxID=46433 RepID=X6NN78_RETFI|nr:hypothetical protein RFI_09958 [Reticulomyxa filosa]|eukprot:ETO27174.1 hypothetical protein RFI_09958 [Reticulomyxa filosa]
MLYVDSELRVVPNECNVLTTDTLSNSKGNKEKTGEIMFETFGTPKLYLAPQSVLSMMASGRFTGIICDSGEGETHVALIHQGGCPSHTSFRLNLGGSDLTAYFQRMLHEQDYHFARGIAPDVVRDMKEKLAFVALDYDSELKNDESSQSYQLPDQREISVGTARFQCAEALFHPDLAAVDQKGIHQLVFQSIMKSDIFIRRELYNNIVMSGGNTMFKGIKERMQKDLKLLAPDGVTVKVIAPAERAHSAWIGGSILGSSLLEETWTTKSEYDEFGSSIVLKKYN